MVCKPILLPRFTGFSKYPGDPLGTLLFYGYLPRFSQEASELPWAACRRSADAGETDPQELINDGIRAFQKGFENIEGECHVIPLSGRLDSRAILAELLRRVEPERLLTVTVGTPGSPCRATRAAPHPGANARYNSNGPTRWSVRRTLLGYQA